MQPHSAPFPLVAAHPVVDALFVGLTLGHDLLGPVATQTMD